MGIFMQKIWERYQKEIKFGGIAVLIFLCFRYFFIYISPFLFAYLICQILYPCADFLHRRCHIPLPAGGVLLFLLVIGLIGLVLYYGICSAGRNLVDFSQDMKGCLYILEDGLCDCLCALEQKFHMQKGTLEAAAQMGLNRIKYGISEKWMPNIVENSISYIQVVGSAFAYLIVIFVAVILMLKDWERYKSALHRKMQRIGGNLLSFLGIYLWAEIRIMTAVGMTCFVGLLVIGVKKAPLLAVLTAFLDVLPFIGTGIVLIPVLLWQIAVHRYRAAVIVGITYVFCILARELLEPKLISEKAGIPPLLTLAGLYMGVYVFGLAGIFLGPIYVLVITLLHRQMFCNS